MRTEVEAVNFRRKAVLDTLVNGVHVGFAVYSPSNAGLVGHDNDKVSAICKHLNGFVCIWEKRQILHSGQEIYFLDKRPVAVNKYCFFLFACWHNPRL